MAVLSPIGGVSRNKFALATIPGSPTSDTNSHVSSWSVGADGYLTVTITSSDTRTFWQNNVVAEVAAPFSTYATTDAVEMLLHVRSPPSTQVSAPFVGLVISDAAASTAPYGLLEYQTDSTVDVSAGLDQNVTNPANPTVTDLDPADVEYLFFRFVNTNTADIGHVVVYALDANGAVLSAALNQYATGGSSANLTMVKLVIGQLVSDATAHTIELGIYWRHVDAHGSGLLNDLP